MSKKIAKIIIISILMICVLLIYDDVNSSDDFVMPAFYSNTKTISSAALDDISYDKTDSNISKEFVQYMKQSNEDEIVEEIPFDPMSLIDNTFKIYQPTEDVGVMLYPRESYIYKHITTKSKFTYSQNMQNGYHKILDKRGSVYYLNDDDMQNKMQLIETRTHAVTFIEDVPEKGEAFIVKYDGDRVLRLTKSLYLEDNVASVIPKGETVYKLRDYGQIFYVVTIDGIAGYMNSQCLETIDIAKKPYDIVTADDSTYGYDEMTEDLNLLLLRYENDLKIVEVGQSTLNHDIPILLLGNEKAPHKILIQASIHAREYASTPTLMKQLEVMLYHLDEPNSSGKTYRHMLDKIAYYIIPMANPDGVLLSQMGEISISDERIRQQVLDIRSDNIEKSDSHEFKYYFEQWKGNINGVDLNRNFDANWDMVHDDVQKPSNNGYKGPSIFSEVESQLIKKYVDMEDVKVTISYHTSGNLLFWWYFQEKDFRYVCLDLANEINHVTRYDIMSKSESRYSHGGVKDYGVMLGKPGITYEIGRYSSPVPPASVGYAAKLTRVLPAIGSWLIDEIEDESEWLNTNLFIKDEDD